MRLNNVFPDLKLIVLRSKNIHEKLSKYFIGLFSFFVVPIIMSDIMIDFMAMIDLDIDIAVN